ncbi:MAG: GDYXXLXY domain-containing protein [Gammaproteobacteria bacterium]|nr:GDYXXLXY domain-containing protein [Gammaproteobacteria bacterium]
MRNKLAVLAGIIILLLVNWSIAGKEKHLKEGKLVYLKLAPVDPRSLMQGDYMALRFAIANEIYNNLPTSDGKHNRWRRNNVTASDGRVVVSLDEKGIASFMHLEDKQPLQNNEVLMRYRVRAGVVKFATNAFFFQEGQAKTYQAAQYGGFRVDNKGELLLTAMYDEKLKRIEARN